MVLSLNTFRQDLKLSATQSASGAFFLPTQHSAFNICHPSLMEFVLETIQRNLQPEPEELILGDRAPQILEIDHKTLILHSRLISVKNLFFEIFYIEESAFLEDHAKDTFIVCRPGQLIYELQDLKLFEIFLQCFINPPFNLLMRQLLSPERSWRKYRLPTAFTAVDIRHQSLSSLVTNIINHHLNLPRGSLVYVDRTPRVLRRSDVADKPLILHTRFVQALLNATRIYFELFFIENSAYERLNSDNDIKIIKPHENQLIFSPTEENDFEELAQYLKKTYLNQS